jgi:hypothetical protein
VGSLARATNHRGQRKGLPKQIQGQLCQPQLQARKDELHMLLTGEKAEVATQQEVAECAADFKGLLQEGYLVERKAFVRSFVNEVRVTGEQVLVNYTIPMSPSKLKKEKNSVLDIVHYGGPLWTRTTDPGLIRTVL